MSFCVNSFHIDSGHDSAPSILVVVVALFMIPVLFTFVKSFQPFVFRFVV